MTAGATGACSVGRTSSISSDVSDAPLESPESDLGIIQDKSEIEDEGKVLRGK